MVWAEDEDGDAALDAEGTEVSSGCVEGKAGSEEGGAADEMGSG